MSAEIFFLVCGIISLLLISLLISYGNRLLFKHMRENGYIGRIQHDEYYVFTFFLMYIPGLNLIYLLALLIIFEITNLEKL